MLDNAPPDLATIDKGALVSFAASVCLPVDSPSLGTAVRELSSAVLTEICVYDGCWPPDVAVSFTLGVADGAKTFITLGADIALELREGMQGGLGHELRMRNK